MNQTVVGLDEVGRGSWAGPLLVTAVILCNPVLDLDDSKKLSSKKRVILANKIKQNAYIGLGWVSPIEIDELGLSQSMSLACNRAVERFDPSAIFIIDGNIDYLGNNNSKAIIKADQSIREVSAASIVAKVTRDSYMKLMSRIYPGYGFENNKGYGTKEHSFGLNKFGLSRIHRMSFEPMKGM